ncbi:hypothetical protein [Sulfuriflexus mobilis]|uniref:hypothetical protein n=1 Tax=Sulfuriflexus mobilis TaxID=1811807 RepID=UPI000F83D896|nr:hypothetical protein [Sulfuriflexus mobilis]
MIKTIRAILICGMIIGLSACATTTVEGDGQLTPTSKSGTHTVHGSFYSFVWSEPETTKCENGRGLYRVRSHTNALYVLASIISIGLYVPQTLEWWCDGKPAQDENEKPYHPAP